MRIVDDIEVVGRVAVVGVDKSTEVHITIVGEGDKETKKMVERVMVRGLEVSLYWAHLLSEGKHK